MSSPGSNKLSTIALLLVAVALLAPGVALAADWPAWRGPQQDGTSAAEGLPSSWSPEGENLIWRQGFTGRSTPIVLDGRVFVQGRAGEGMDMRELVAAFDAETGEKLWERVLPVFLTTVPFNRAGWPSLGADRETGYLYAQGVGGLFVCLDRDGNIVWQRSLLEEYGRYSGYGGRTHTPLVDEDQVIISNINSTWGSLGAPRHRHYSFDKRTGELRWISTPGGQPYDLNTQSNGTIAVINGQRLYIAGNADGHVYAIKARTGEKVWGFELSKRGINSSPLVVGSTVFIGHSEENVDEARLGRVVAIDGTGTGDVTKTHELWRQDIAMGFPSPAYQDGRLYVMDNGANLYALDASSGEHHWEFQLGTVGKSAPVLADGKMFVTEVNGLFHILAPKENEAQSLDRDEISMPDGRYAEIYGSPAVAYGRIYFTTEEGVYCIGREETEYEVAASPPLDLPEEDRGSDKPTVIRVVPAEKLLVAGDQADFEAWAYNEKGRRLGPVDATWSLDGLAGEFQGSRLTTAEGRTQAGRVVAKVGDLEARGRVRSFTPLPHREDFSIEGTRRDWWIGAGRYTVSELDGEKVLEKPVADRGLLRSKMFIGPDTFTDYTVTADLRGGLQGRRKTDGGLINSGYILDLQGIDQELEIRSWTAELRMAKTVPFAWEMDTWYTMKLRVEQHEGKAVILGKVWKRGEEEPADWTIRAEDPYPVQQGAPGVQAYSPASFYFDNVVVTGND